MTQSGYEVQDCCRTIFFMSVVFDVRCFHFRVFQFFKASTSRPGTAYGDFDFSKAGFRASKPSAAVFIFQKTRASRLKNIHDGLNVFQKPALHASKPSTVVLIFQKSALHTSVPPTAVPIYSMKRTQ